MTARPLCAALALLALACGGAHDHNAGLHAADGERGGQCLVHSDHYRHSHIAGLECIGWLAFQRKRGQPGGRRDWASR